MGKKKVRAKIGRRSTQVRKNTVKRAKAKAPMREEKPLPEKSERRKAREWLELMHKEAPNEALNSDTESPTKRRKVTFDNDDDESAQEEVVEEEENKDTIYVKKTEYFAESSFSEVGALDRRLVAVLESNGCLRPTYAQQAALGPALERRDIILAAPTGTGKTLAYVVPTLQAILEENTKASGGDTIRALILVPTTDLAEQVSGVLDKFTTILAGEVSAFNAVRWREERAKRPAKKGRQTRPQPPPSASVVLGTPTSVLEYMKAVVDKTLDNLITVIVDEADVVLSFYGFEQEIKTLATLVLPSRASQKYQVILGSATMSSDVENLAHLMLYNPVRFRFEVAKENASIEEKYMLVKSDEKYSVLYGLLKLGILPRRTLIFCTTTEDALKLHLFLKKFDIPSAILASIFPLTTRRTICEAFNTDQVDILIATDEATAISVSKKPAEFKAERGLDLASVNVVINFDVARDVDTYTHRIGRTGRAGTEGNALSFFDVETVRDMAQLALLQRRPNPPEELEFKPAIFSCFNYRVNDALSGLTKKMINQTKSRFLQEAALRDKRLADFFVSNTRDFKALKMAVASRSSKVVESLKSVPFYLQNLVLEAEGRHKLQ